MNQPAPDWPAAPDPSAAAAPPAPLAFAPVSAPPLTAAPAPLVAVPDAPALQAMPQFAAPTSLEAALDVAVPLMPVVPQQVAAPLMPAAPAAPTAPAPPAPAAATHADHPTSLAMPTAVHEPTPSAMPTYAAAAVSSAPQQIGGVTAAHPADLADRAARAVDHRAPAVDVDPTGQWWAPGTALVLAVAALAWQLLAYYARVQLPVVKTSGTPMTNFDRVVDSLPFAHGAMGQVIGVLLGAGALFVVLYGSRRGLREPQLQLAIGAIACISLLTVVVLPILRG